MSIEQGYHISTFEQGDLIIRCKPAECRENKYNDNLGTEVSVLYRTDESYMDTPLMFYCIENNVIYLKHPCPKDDWDKKRIYKLPLRHWSDGWMPFILPEGLTLEQCVQ